MSFLRLWYSKRWYLWSWCRR